jgi:hypothetical protein
MAAWADRITTSLFGRRIGLQVMSSGITGGSRGPSEFLVGPDGARAAVTTAESTGTNLNPFGVSNLVGTSAASSAVYVLDPPIPGVRKTINIGTTANGPIYVRTANSETFSSTLGTSFTTIKSSAGGNYEMMGLTTALWILFGVTSGTSSNASGHVLTTST